MLFILAALVTALATLPHFGPTLGITIPFQVEPHVALLSVSGFLAIIGVLSFFKKPKVIVTQDTTALEEARALRAQLDEIATDYRQMKEREKAMQQAVDQAQRKLEEERAKIASQDKTNAEVVNLLSLFQAKGRFIDFLMQDITPYSDAQVGSVARYVHQGCSAVLRDHFDVEAIYQGNEGDPFTVKGDTDLRRYRLIGKVSDTRPLRGKVVHKGWKSKKVTVPRVFADSGDTFVIAPAEVEVAS
jgi:hypothetical protein